MILQIKYKMNTIRCTKQINKKNQINAQTYCKIEIDGLKWNMYNFPPSYTLVLCLWVPPLLNNPKLLQFVCEFP